MPYGDDSWIEANDKSYAELRQRCAAENNESLRQKLREKFNVPDAFLDLAVRIWWDGKLD